MSVEAENKRALNSENDDSSESWDGPKLSEINQNPDSSPEPPQPEPKRRKSNLTDDRTDLELFFFIVLLTTGF